MSFINSENINIAYPPLKESIPKSSLGYNTNNKYPEFPPLMQDGRSITASYQPQSVINDMLIQNNNIKSNWEYRNYLINNGNKIMQYNFVESSNDVGYYKRYDDLHSKIHSSPFLYTDSNDKRKPLGYVNSDLKNLYLSREELEKIHSTF